VAVDASGHARNGAYQPGAQLANGTLLRSSSTRYVMLGGAANAYIDVSAATAFCASGAWSIECWASIASYANAAGANGRYAGTAGVRFIGNTTWTGGSSRQPGSNGASPIAIPEKTRGGRTRGCGRGGRTRGCGTIRA